MHPLGVTTKFGWKLGIRPFYIDSFSSWRTLRHLCCFSVEILLLFFCLLVFLGPELQSALLLFRPNSLCVVHRQFQFQIHVFTQVGWSHGNLCASAAGSLWWGNLSLPLLWSERSVGLSVAPGDCCPHVAEGPIGCTPDLQDVIPPLFSGLTKPNGMNPGASRAFHA